MVVCLVRLAQRLGLLLGRHRWRVVSLARSLAGLPLISKSSIMNDEQENDLISRLNNFFPTLSRFHECVLGLAAVVCVLVALDFLSTSHTNLAAAVAPGVVWLLLLWRKPPTKGRKMWVFITCLWGLPLVGIVYLRLLELLHRF